MRSIAGFTLIILFMLILTSCKKEVMKYDSQDTVFFMKDSTIYSFMDKPTSMSRDTVLIHINLIGKISSHSREIKIILDSTDATVGTDFSIIQPVVLGPDSTYGFCRVVLNRTPVLQNSRKTIWLSIQHATELGLAQLASGGSGRHKVSFSDLFGKPLWWNLYFNKYTYSDIRFRFYMSVLGSAKAPITGQNGAGYTLQASIYLLKAATAEYNSTHPEVLSDEFGPITW